MGNVVNTVPAKHQCVNIAHASMLMSALSLTEPLVCTQIILILLLASTYLHKKQNPFNKHFQHVASKTLI